MPTRKPSIAARSRPASKTRARGGGSHRATSIDSYLAGVSDDKRVVLEKLRATIRKIVPDAEEGISYALPAFRWRGKVVAGFAATIRGCSYFPFSGSTLGSLGDELSGYDRTKSALHFTIDKPLPSRLVRKLLEARMAEIHDG